MTSILYENLSWIFLTDCKSWYYISYASNYGHLVSNGMCMFLQYRIYIAENIMVTRLYENIPCWWVKFPDLTSFFQGKRSKWSIYDLRTADLYFFLKKKCFSLFATLTGNVLMIEFPHHLKSVFKFLLSLFVIVLIFWWDEILQASYWNFDFQLL